MEAIGWYLLASGPSSQGAAIFSILSIAGLAIVGSYTVSYACHAYCAAAEATAGGQDEISWPEEPLVDRLSKTALLVWAAGIAVAPAVILGKIVGGTWLIAAITFALLFPIVLLSIDAGSFYTVFHPSAIGRILRKPWLLLGYYFAVVPAIALALSGLWIIGYKSRGLLLIGAYFVSFAIVLLGRLYGRLAHCIGQVGFRIRDDVEDEEKELPMDVMRQAADRSAATNSARRRPSASSYAMRESNAPTHQAPDAPRLKRLWVEEGADDPYALSDPTPAAPKQRLPANLINIPEEEMKLAMRNRPIPAPKHPWLIGTFTFPFRPSSWRPIAWLTFGFAICGLFFRAVSW